MHGQGEGFMRRARFSKKHRAGKPAITGAPRAPGERNGCTRAPPRARAAHASPHSRRHRYANPLYALPPSIIGSEPAARVFGHPTNPCNEGVVHGAKPHARNGAPDAKPWAKRWTLAATILGSSMAFIDGSVVSVALPAMQADLSAGARGAQWIVNAYTLMLGALILVGGAMGDRLGRRLIFVLGIVLFTLASVGCGLAPNIDTLIIARAVQGIGGALLVPSSLAIISAIFPEQERGRAIGTWAGASALTTALGPVVGGWLVDSLSWRAIFFVNVPIAALAVALALWHVPETRNDVDKAGVDWKGGVLATLGLGALAYGFTAASDFGWSDARVLGSLLAGAIVLTLFVLFEARTSAPMVPLHLFRSKSFTGANLITLLLYFAMNGALYFLPFNLIRVQGYSAVAAGAAFLPMSLMMGGLSRWTGGLFDRFGARMPLMVGPTIVAVGFVLLTLPGIGGSYWTTFFPPMIVAPLTTTVMRAVDDKHGGVASGVNNATARIAGMLAVALLGAVAMFVFRMSLEERTARLHLSSEVHEALRVEASKLADAGVPRAVPSQQHGAVEQALHESFVQSCRAAMWVSAVLALLSALTAWLTVDGKRAPTTNR
jgi:EmrB/QacA subfamily drug resistance transporter